ncbi:hypothetical protein D9619_003882 [Psilocybe cf. subviscida]|uniref:Uncharacterized protein n=1 Tax=Psilocybe cf. subviscida TaxID=2480587 RepID=A0A8H5BP14_9AGAR|nr:hypothetical protein D9619_003882 [Psilocybe cf. subviscida]
MHPHATPGCPSLPAFRTTHGRLSRGFRQAVVAALIVSLAIGQPSLGAFSLQDEEDDVDVICGLEEVHDKP